MSTLDAKALHNCSFVKSNLPPSNNICIIEFASTPSPFGEVTLIIFISASSIEEKVHPGIYKRRSGKVNIETLKGPGFGYRIEEINRTLPKPIEVFGNSE